MRPKVRNPIIKFTVLPSSFLSSHLISLASGKYGSLNFDSVYAMILPIDSTLIIDASQNRKNMNMNMK
jgi:hypothetical protein